MDVLKVIISVLTFVLGMCVCIKYKLTMAFLKSRGSLDMHETLVTSGMLLPLLLELLIVLPHPFPFVDTVRSCYLPPFPVRSVLCCVTPSRRTHRRRSAWKIHCWTARPLRRCTLWTCS